MDFNAELAAPHDAMGGGPRGGRATRRTAPRGSHPRGVPLTAGGRLALAGAVLAALVALATLVFVAAWALGGSTRLAHRASPPISPPHAVELTDGGPPGVGSLRAPLTSVVLVMDADGTTHGLVWSRPSIGGTSPLGVVDSPLPAGLG